MGIQTITLDDLELDTLIGLIGELVDDQKLDSYVRRTYDSIYQKLDSMENYEEVD